MNRAEDPAKLLWQIHSYSLSPFYSIDESDMNTWNELLENTENEIEFNMSNSKFPYQKYELTKLWAVLEKGIGDLVENQDIEELTDRKYIIGYLCQLILNTNELDEN